MATQAAKAKSFLWPVRRAFRLARHKVRNLIDPSKTKQLSPTLLAKSVRYSDFLIWVDSGDELISWMILRGDGWEGDVTNCLKSHLTPGMTFLDIGANVGFHTLTGAHLVGPRGRVHAIEMSPTNCLLIRESIAANNYRHVTLHETAVSFEEGTVRYCMTPGTTNCTVFSDQLRETVGDNCSVFVPQHSVPMTTVDKLIPNQHVDVVKIDVEGFELHVFRGMERILSESRPTIVFEFFPSMLRSVGNVEPADLLNFLRSHGYQFRQVDDRSDALYSNEEILARAIRDPKIAYIDLIAVPVAS